MCQENGGCCGGACGGNCKCGQRKAPEVVEEHQLKDEETGTAGSVTIDSNGNIVIGYA